MVQGGNSRREDLKADLQSLGLLDANGDPVITEPEVYATYLLTTGQETVPRWLSASNVALGLGTNRLTYFTARKSEISTQVRLNSGSTAAASLTLCRIGLYSVDPATGDLTLIASTPSDTSLFIAANTVYTKSWSSPVSLIAGTRYALGVIVTGTTPPTLAGIAVNIPGNEPAQPPKISAMLTAQSDLTTPITNASLTNQAQLVYAVLLP